MNIVNEKLNTSNATKALFIYGLLCLIIAFVLSFNTGQEIKQTVSMQGGDFIGPLKVAKANTVYLIDVIQSVSSNSWTFLNIDVLDEQKQYLFSFGDELWHESGYDSEGGWSESNNSFNLKMTLPKKGIYYFNLKGEKGGGNTNSHATVTINQKVGSSLALSILGIISLLAAVAVWYFRNKDKFSSSGGSGSNFNYGDD